jgi:hypothetical protein
MVKACRLQASSPPLRCLDSGFFVSAAALWSVTIHNHCTMASATSSKAAFPGVFSSSSSPHLSFS